MSNMEMNLRSFADDLKAIGIEATYKEGEFMHRVNIQGVDFFFCDGVYDGWGMAAGSPYPCPDPSMKPPEGGS